MSLSDFLNGRKYRETAEDLKKAVELLEAQAAQHKQEAERLKGLLTEMGGIDVARIRDLIGREHQALQQAQANRAEVTKAVDMLRAQASELRATLLVLDEQQMLESFALYIPKFAFSSSADYKARLDAIRDEQKTMIREGYAAHAANPNWTVNNSAKEGKRLINDMIKLMIRSFNNEADYCVDNVKFNNVELGEKRINQSFDALNKLGQIMAVSISPQYRQSKLDELHLAHEFQIKKQEEKEEAKRLREELREQQKLEQEIRAAREKIAKERKHFESALKELNARLAKASEEEKASLREKIEEINGQRAALDGKEREIDYREKSAKAGYVYVISNLGAFGEGVLKIGMTRRLEPLERVDELGDASVPFNFDVHALVFSDDAPDLEAKLHEHFAETRLNRVNPRKEFFRADVVEVEAVIRKHYDKVVEVVKEAPAEQFRESLRLAKAASAPARVALQGA